LSGYDVVCEAMPYMRERTNGMNGMK